MAAVKYAHGKLTTGELVDLLAPFPRDTRVDLHRSCSEWPAQVVALSITVAPAFFPSPAGTCGGPVAAVLIGGEGDPVWPSKSPPKPPAGH